MAKDSVHRTIAPPPPQQRVSPPRRRKATRRTSPPPTLTRQQTLTQLDGGVSFLELPGSEEDTEWAESRSRKRRRRTQATNAKRQPTLTQIGYVSTIPPSDDEGMDEHMAERSSDEENEGDVSTTAESEASLDEDATDVRSNTSDKQGRATVQRYTRRITLKDIQEEVAENSFEEPMNKIPQTPQKIRKLEIPSSQSPAITPLSSIRTQRSFDMRSPSQHRSTRRPSLPDSPSRSRKGNNLHNNPSNNWSHDIHARDALEVSSSIAKTNVKIQRNKSFIQDSLDGSDYDPSETEDEDTSFPGHGGIDIGQETQAVIHKIDLACGAQHSVAQSSDIESDNEGTDDAAPYGFPGQDLDIQQESQLRSSPPFMASSARERVSSSPPALHARIQDSFTRESTPKAIGGNQGHQSDQRFQKVSTPTRQSGVTTQGQTAASRSKNAHGWSHFPQPSQATTTASTTQDGSPARSPTRLQLSSSPFPMAPPTSSPVTIQQSYRQPKHHRVGVDRVVTASQLLPDSLMDLSIPPPPRWTQDDEEDG
ncbi:uncharacterized protein K452DRAFT_310794 [Aplosporella prunicola CBS 121167]|uniref:Uncharacterized protein n=1 Tax=Aplosporella prunicola CBS 121167 TaxID=1176127 RepID=A0A6A6B675_9PEZI|nr:uncharacterized protein K452DRAFT_310794 [Aplosporella prunicola CBS 121167]KAF2139366.1 hypothetical protein K452DRAFT_310794 [Aplosporella prunicola CBS 121167]